MANNPLTALAGLVYPEPCVVTLLAADLAVKVDRSAELVQNAVADRIAVLVQNAVTPISVTRGVVPSAAIPNAVVDRDAAVDQNAAVVVRNAVLQNAACLARGARVVFPEEHRIDRICRRRVLAVMAEARVELRLRSVEFLLPQEQEQEQEQEPLL